MADFNWKGIDLNLLIALQALHKTSSVSKAAERCYVSQSAMSHSLQRLRKLFDDPLFERVGSRMEATERAIELSSTVDALLRLFNLRFCCLKGSKLIVIKAAGK